MMLSTFSKERTEKLFGLEIWRSGFAGAMALIRDRIDIGTGEPSIVVTPNVDHIVRLYKDRELFELYRQAEYIFPDGFPIVLASKLLGTPLRDRVAGADLFPAVCGHLANRSGRAFIFGGVPGNEDRVDNTLAEKYSGLHVKSFAPPYGFRINGAESERAAGMINEWQPHVVFVCLGMPKQEQWAFRYRDRLLTKMIFCVGAALDFEIGNVRRAPAWVRRANLEWFWRLCSNPARLWRRYLVDDMAFVKILLNEWKMNRRGNTQ